MSAPVSARKINQILRAHNAAALQGITLRDYQRDAIDGVLAEVRKGNRRVLLVAPTGAGKTVMFAALAVLFHAAGLRVLVVAHRKELIEQAVRKLRASGVAKVGVWRGKKNSSETDAQVMVAAIQALRSAKIDADLVIVDEAHHAPARSYRELLNLYPEAVHVGATATPWWSDGHGLGAYFNAIVTATTVRALTDARHLARARVFTHPHTLHSLDLRGIQNESGDYRVGPLVERMDKPSLLGDIVEHWTTHASGVRTLVFAASVEHSQHIAARFRDAGIVSEHLDGSMPSEDRDAILRRLHDGETTVVCNYGVLTEGFDEPKIGCVIMARPTRRLTVYLQAVGRALRVSDDKDSAIVLDHAGLCLAFGLPDTEYAYALSQIEEETPQRSDGEPMVRRCPECGLCVPLGTVTCPECEHGSSPRRVPTERPDGILVEVVCASNSRETLTFNGKTRTIPQWSRVTRIPLGTLRRRLKFGWSVERALTTPAAKRLAKVLLFRGRTQSKIQWSKELRIPSAVIDMRLAAGWSIEDALGRPVRRQYKLFG